MHEIVEVATAVKAIGVGDPTLIRAFSPGADPTVAPAHWRADTGREGRLLLHLFVDEEPPVAIATYLREQQRLRKMLVPSGRLLVAGEEAFYGSPAEEFGGEVAIPPGEYDLVACRCQAPPDLIDRRFRERATPAQRQAWSIVRSIGWIALVGSAVAVVSAWILERRAGPFAALVPVVLVAGVVYVLSRYRAGEAYQSAEALRDSLKRDVPDYAVVLHRHSDQE